MQSRRCLFFSQSLQVEEEVAARVLVKPMKVKSQGVLERINGLIIDMSGMMLESAAMEFCCQDEHSTGGSRVKLGQLIPPGNPFR